MHTVVLIETRTVRDISLSQFSITVSLSSFQVIGIRYSVFGIIILLSSFHIPHFQFSIVATVVSLAFIIVDVVTLILFIFFPTSTSQSVSQSVSRQYTVGRRRRSESCFDCITFFFIIITIIIVIVIVIVVFSYVY
jgi:hypothetical protein